jgi:methyl-accepting chemotaxis protein
MFNRLSIQFKITALAGLCLFAIVSLLVSASLYQAKRSAEVVKHTSSSMLEDSAQKRLKARAESQALRIQRDFMTNYLYGQGLAGQVALLQNQAKKGAITAHELRTTLVSLVGNALKAKPELLGLYVAFEPNALDSQDEHFVEDTDTSSNEKGRFALYWSQGEPGEFESESMTEEELTKTTPGPSGAAYNAWYTCPRDTRKPCLLDPYFDEVNKQQVLMTSIALPIEQQGKVVGVIGMDISLNTLQGMAEKASAELYKGEVDFSIVSPAGLLAADSRDAKLLGQSIDKVYASQASDLRQAIVSGQSTLLSHVDQLSVLEPISPIPGVKTWGIFVEAPKKVILARALELSDELDARRLSDSTFSIAVGLVAVFIGLLLMWFTARSVTRPILGVAAMLKDIASGEGDLTRRLGYARDDELGQLAGWFNRFLDKLQPIIADVKRSVQDARSTADQSASIATHTSQGMQEQFREVEQVATASHEMSATAHDVARNAAQAAEAARGADHATHEGLDIINETTRSIERLASDMNSAMGQVEGLAKSSEQIGSVLEVIRGVAEQTNLLALNAAIEAARAGEAGRGFAVVADEVRGLARRTRESVDEIGQVIDGLQKGTLDVVASMHNGHRQAQSNVEHVEQAVTALRKIGDAVSVITEMNMQIASAAEEQSAVAEEINRNVAGIREVTESLSGQAEESARVSQALNELANHQQTLMDQFKV